MANPHHPCEICRLRHRPGNCRASENALCCVHQEGHGNLHFPSPSQAQGNQCHSMPTIIADLARICGDLSSLVGKLPCVKATMVG